VTTFPAPQTGKKGFRRTRNRSTRAKIAPTQTTFAVESPHTRRSGGRNPR